MTTPEEFGLGPESQPSKNTEVSELRERFEELSRRLEGSREVLKTAQALKGDRPVRVGSKEYQLIFQRQQQGESIDEIVVKSAESLRSDYEATMEAELPYQEANVAMLRSEGYTPGTDVEVLRVVEGIEKSYAMRISDPVNIEIHKRLIAGESLAEIRAKAEESVNARLRAAKILSKAEAMKNPSHVRLLDYDTDMIILGRISMGETIDDIIEKSRAELEKYDQDNQKRRELAESLGRVEELKRIQKKN